jgi:hypothetical protein
VYFAAVLFVFLCLDSKMLLFEKLPRSDELTLKILLTLYACGLLHKLLYVMRSDEVRIEVRRTDSRASDYSTSEKLVRHLASVFLPRATRDEILGDISELADRARHDFCPRAGIWMLWSQLIREIICHSAGAPLRLILNPISDLIDRIRSGN